jgi:hypothetical protein
MGGWRRRLRPSAPAAPVVAPAALVLAAGCTVRIRPEPAPTSMHFEIHRAEPDLAQQLFEARVARIGGDREAAPQLRWTAASDCPAGG